MSLNLAKRKTEREEQEKERLNLINTRRLAHHEPPLTSLEKLDPEQEPDANLAESAHVVADLIAMGAPPATQLSRNTAPASAAH